MRICLQLLRHSAMLCNDGIDGAFEFIVIAHWILKQIVREPLFRLITVFSIGKLFARIRWLYKHAQVVYFRHCFKILTKTLAKECEKWFLGKLLERINYSWPLETWKENQQTLRHCKKRYKTNSRKEVLWVCQTWLEWWRSIVQSRTAS